MDYSHRESENLLGVCDRLNDALQVLADQSLDLRFGTSDTIDRGHPRVHHLEVHLDKGLRVVCLGAKLGLRGTLE